MGKVAAAEQKLAEEEEEVVVEVVEFEELEKILVG